MKMKQTRILQLVVVSLITVAGYLTLHYSSAASPTVSIEPEAAIASAGNVSTGVDSSASAGKTVLFGNNDYGPRQATMPANAVTPEQYGAVGDGVHDDTAAVQAAVNAAAGKTAWLSANKTYLCNKQIAVASNTTLAGAGPSSALKFSWFDTANESNGQGAYVRSKNQQAGESNITITNFVIIGAGSGAPSGLNADNPNGLAPSLQLNNITDFTVSQMEIKQSPGISLTYRAASNGTIAYNDVHESGRDGITGFWSPIRNLTNININHNHIAHVGDDGIAINGLEDLDNSSALPSDITITNNTVAGWVTPPNNRLLGRGIAVIGAHNLTLSHNSIANTAGAGIMLVACSNNFCTANAHDPVTGRPWLSSNLTVTNNTIANAGQISGALNRGVIDGGIYINAMSNTTVSGNVITNPHGTAITSTLCDSCSLQSN